jgi:hypothetical protein
VGTGHNTGAAAARHKLRYFGAEEQNH